MATNLDALENWVAPLIEKLQPGERRRLAVAVARDLRREQAANMAAQRGPDGTAWEPRKPLRDARGKIRKLTKRQSSMFVKLRTAKHLKAQATPNMAAVGFLGRTSRIARVHQDGAADEVKPGGPTYRYPVRELLGISEQSAERVRELLMKHLEGRGL